MNKEDYLKKLHEDSLFKASLDELTDENEKRAVIKLADELLSSVIDIILNESAK